MRILILSDRIPPENVGGAEKVAWTMAQGLKDAGHDVHIIAATAKPSFEEIREGIPTYHLQSAFHPRLLPFYTLYNVQTVDALRTLYQRLQPDVVSAFNIHSHLSYASLTIAHQMGIPTTATLQDVMAFSYTKLTHFIDPSHCGVASPDAYRLPRFHNLKTMRLRFNPIRNAYIRRILNHQVDVKIAGSDALSQALGANGLPDFRVIYASVTPQDFHVSPEKIDALRQHLGLAGRKVILFAGRLTRDKGSEQLLAALSQVVQQVPDVTLLTLTRASLEDQGLTHPDYAHLLPHVCVGGWMQGETLAAAYHLADVVTVPSICLDVFPTINLEAMAVSKPVVATCYGGSPEAVLDGQTGYIVNPFDTRTFADRLTQLLTHPDQAQAMGAAGYARLTGALSIKNQVEQLLKAYHDARQHRSMTSH